MMHQSSVASSLLPELELRLGRSAEARPWASSGWAGEIVEPALLDELPLGIVLIDPPQARLLSINRCATRLLGRPGAGLAGDMLEQVLPAPLAALCQAERWRQLSPGRSVRETLSLDSLQGVARCLQVQRSLVHAPGRNRALGLLTLQDMSGQLQLERALRESDARFREVTEAVAECLFVTTPDWQRLHFASPLLLDLLGLAAAELHLVPSLFERLVHAEDRAQHERLRQLSKAGDSSDLVLRLQHPQRGWRWMRLRSRAQAHSDGQPLVYHILSDVSEEQQRHRELAQARDEAEAASRAKSEFISNISHEVRTPLNGMLGMTELLLASGLTAQQRQHAEAALQSALQLKALLDGVLDLSDAQSGRASSLQQPYLPQALAREALAALQAQAAAKGLTLTLLDAAAGLPTQALGDAAKIRQVLGELLGNALKFTAQGGIELALRCEPGAGGHDWLVYTVSDTGIGLPQDQLPRLFEPFTQAQAGLARRFGGAGLGLARVQALAGLMGGEVRVDASRERGASVALRLPLQPLPPAAPSPQPRAAMILVVDDNPVNQQVSAEMLDCLGYRVRVCCDAASGLQAMCEQRFDLVMMDIQMPGMDGMQALSCFRAGPSAQHRFVTPDDTPIVAVTANALEEDGRQLRCHGFDDYLPKPFRLAELQELLERCLDGGNNGALEVVLRHPRNPAPRTAMNMSTPTDADAVTRPAPTQGAAVLDAQALQHLRELDPQGGNKLLERVVQAFVKSLERLLPELERARHAGPDLAGVRHVSHTLKSSSASLGALELSRRCAEIEAMARNGQAEGLENRLDGLHDELARVRTALAELLMAPR